MTWQRFMLGFLAVLTVLQVFVILLVDARSLWAIVPQALPMVALWVGFAYRYAPAFRVWVVRVLAYFGDQRTSMRVSARFAVTGELAADDVIEVIRERYKLPAGGDTSVRVFRSSVRTIVEMPGWIARFEFSPLAPQEELIGDHDSSPMGDFLFTMPDTQNAIESARSLLEGDILPLFETLTQKLPLKLEATEVTIRFLKQPNPYLAAYLQNIDLERVTRLNCVIQEPLPNVEAAISRDKIALRAANLNDMRGLAEKHLALQWSVR